MAYNIIIELGGRKKNMKRNVKVKRTFEILFTMTMVVLFTMFVSLSENLSVFNYLQTFFILLPFYFWIRCFAGFIGINLPKLMIPITNRYIRGIVIVMVSAFIAYEFFPYVTIVWFGQFFIWKLLSIIFKLPSYSSLVFGSITDFMNQIEKETAYNFKQRVLKDRLT